MQRNVGTHPQNESKIASLTLALAHESLTSSQFPRTIFIDLIGSWPQAFAGEADMKNRFQFLAAIVVLTVVAADTIAGMAPRSAFAKYDTILTRKLFGATPATPVHRPAPKQSGPAPRNPDQGFATRMRITYLEKAKSGDLLVGIYDDKSKWSATLKIGQSQDGITLVDASYKDEKALLRKGTREEEVTSQIMTRRPPAASAPAPYWLQRKKAREERVKQMRERVANQRPLTKEEQKALEKHLRDYNMKLIRAGGELGPPLPIKLSAEEDAELVREGYLPPLK